MFKYPTSEKDRSGTGAQQDGTLDYKALDGGSGDGKEVWFAAQTIQNACGTQALLSVLLNKGSDDGVKVGGPLGEFKEFTMGFPADVSACLHPL